MNPLVTANQSIVTRVGALATVHGLSTAALALVMASAPTLKSDFQLNQTEYGLLISCFFAGQVVLAIPAGSLIDRIGVRYGLAISVAASTFALAAIAIVSKPGIAGLLMFLLGAASVFVNPAAAKGVSDWVPVARRALAMSVKQMGVPIGSLVAAAGAYLAGSVGRADVFLLLACCVAMGGAVILLLPKDATEHGRSKPARLSALLTNRRLMAAGISNSLLNVAQLGMLVSAAAYGAALGGGAELGAIFFAVLHGGSLIGRMVLGIVGNLIGLHRLWILVLLVGCTGAVAFLVLAGTEDLVYVICALAVLGLTVGSYPGLLQAIALTTVPPHSAAAAIGINIAIVLAGGMITPLLVGAAVDIGGGFPTAFVALAIASVAGCCVVLIAQRGTEQGQVPLVR